MSFKCISSLLYLKETCSVKNRENIINNNKIISNLDRIIKSKFYKKNDLDLGETT